MLHLTCVREKWSFKPYPNEQNSDKRPEKGKMQTIFQQDSVDWANNKGTYHLTENFKNSGWKVNGKITLGKFQQKIEVYVLR